MLFADPVAALDPWVASSLLQKAIRRGAVDHAVHAARTLYRQRGASIWRRFLIIACEDAGIADLDLVRDVACLSDRTVRRTLGTDNELVTETARRLAEAPKDRSSDYLICAAIQHPGHERERVLIAGLSPDEQIAIAVDRDQPLIRRAIATWYASGINGGGPPVLGPGDLSLLLHRFEALGVPHASTIESAARKTKEPMVVMLPLLWALLQESSASRVQDIPLPAASLCRCVPAWAFDKHTRIGKQAVARLIRENPAVDAVLSAHVPDFRARDVGAMAAFYVDAIPIARRLMWDRAHDLEALGLETDMLKVGCPKQAIRPIVETVLANLDHLDSIRCRLFAAQSPSGSAT